MFHIFLPRGHQRNEVGYDTALMVAGNYVGDVYSSWRFL